MSAGIYDYWIAGSGAGSHPWANLDGAGFLALRQGARRDSCAPRMKPVA